MEANAPVPPDAPVPPYEPYPTDAGDSAGRRTTIHEAAMRPDDAPVRSPPAADARDAAAFSVDDLEVAKALTGLRAASPAQSTTSTTVQSAGTQSPRAKPQPEPLLSLLTSQHPLIASTITSAYSTSKTYSPRFRQGAEFVERNLASPVANTVSTAGRISGVETGVRWMLRRHSSNQSADDHDADQSHKRRRLDPDAMDLERGSAPEMREREPSETSPMSEYLPAYDDNRSPKYEEFAVMPGTGTGAGAAATASPTPATAAMPLKWQTRLMISTSGLGVAMSDESLRSLKYCLSWLRWANTHLNRVLASLQSVLEEWERSQASLDDPESAILQSPPLSPTTGPMTPGGAPRPPRDAATIAKHLAALRAECVRTLKSALDVVSTYAGGSLPENARHLVRRHLTSLPMRFQLASSQDATLSQPGSAAHSRRGSVVPGSEGDALDAPTPEAISGAQRVVVLAREGLDMMTQVSAVVDGTIVSAESWCERLGRRPRQSAPLTEADAKLPLDDSSAPHPPPQLLPLDTAVPAAPLPEKPIAVHAEAVSVAESDVTMGDADGKAV